jgi:Fe-S oxidoreductase
MKDEIQDGVPVVGLEPSCTAVFRDELKGLFPQRFDAKRLARQTYLLPEFIHACPEPFESLLKRGEKSEKSRGRLLLHVHCHQHAIMGAKADIAVLKRLGFDVEHLDSGCCGMAGSFGFEREHYQISKQIGEQVLIPAVKAAGADVPVVTNGFSCREQIEQLADRKPIHFAQLLRDLCLGDG